MKLRDYQERALARFRESRAKSILIVAPTGAGKGTMAVALIAEYVAKKLPVVVLVHRRELVRDMTERLAKFGIGVAQTIHSDQLVRVVAVQREFGGLPVQRPSLLVVDEAHHYAADVWGKVAGSLRAKRTVGFTATPQRRDGRSLGDMFDELIEAASYSELISRGLIVPCRVLRPRFKMRNELAKDPVDAYLRYAKGDRALIFTSRVIDAGEVHKRLAEAGIRSDVLTATTKVADRDQMVKDLETGRLDVLVNVSVLTEGFDAPHLETIVLARPCLHASMFIQIAGRGVRAAEGKKEAKLIDLVGATHTHGLPTEDRVYSLHGTGIDREATVQTGVRTRGQGEPTIVLDLDLEEVQPTDLPRVEKPTSAVNLKPKRSVAELGNQAYAPLTRAAPQPRTQGFIFQDRDWWFLRWREYGVKFRMGLSTQDKDVAEACLALFRAEGPAAVKDNVRMRKRTAVSLWRHNHRKNKNEWRLRYWNDDATEEIGKRFYTTDENEARHVQQLMQHGKRAEAFALIDRLNEENRIRANRARAEARRRQGPIPGAGRKKAS